MKELTPEQRAEGLRILKRAAEIAQKHGVEMIKESDMNPRQAIAAACIILSTYAVGNGLTLHDMMGVLMEVHKQTVAMHAEHMQ